MNPIYTIISGTNREVSTTLNIARLYQERLQQQGIEAKLLHLSCLKTLVRDGEFEQLEQEILMPSQKFIFVSPEYNGSIPGVLKLMLDLSDYRKVWVGKKALLTGLSSGRAGNLRGMEHLTGILHYLKVIVHPNKLPISSIETLIDGSGMLVDRSTLLAIDTQLGEFIEF